MEREHFRLSLLPPPTTSFVPYNFAISPDGHRLAFVASTPDGRTALWIRSLSAGTAQQLTGTEGAMYPFWSPNNRQVGFFSEGKLKTVDPSGGAVQIVCDAFQAFGGTWNNQGMIVFSGHRRGRSPDLPSGLLKVPATGGTPEPVVNTDSPTIAMIWPEFLPDGDHFFYFVRGTLGSVQRGIYVASLASKSSKMVSSDIMGNTRFASGRLFYVRDRSLLAQLFDVKGLQTNGPAEQIAQQELQQDPGFQRAGFSVSDTGVVVFQSAADNSTRLAWFDRAGTELDEIPAIGYRDPTLSRDGRFLAVSSDDARNGENYIRLYDLNRGTSARVSDGGSDSNPLFSPDGQRVAYQGNDGNNVYVTSTDGASRAETLLESVGLIPNDWSPDGRYMVYMDFQAAPAELAIYDFHTRSHSVFGSGVEAQISPDGKWLAFGGAGSNGYQNSDIFITQFPKPGGRVQISNHGGAQPRWSPDGKELFYISEDKKLMAVTIDTATGKVVAGVPHMLFQTRIIAARIVLFQYAVSPDGKRFLINSLPSVGASPLTVLMN